MDRVKTQKSKEWTSTLSSQIVTESALKQELADFLNDVLPKPAIVALVTDYVVAILVWDGPTYYDMHHPYHVKRIPQQLRVPTSGFWGGEREVRELLERDLVSEIEMTQDCNIACEYYRAYIRTRHDCTYHYINGGEKKELLASISYEPVPFGAPKEQWPIQFGGPKLRDMPTPAIYRLSNGVVFDAIRRTEFQIKFIRRQ